MTAPTPPVSAPYELLSELLEHPELLEPPPVVVPRLVWEGRVTLFASQEKLGKSTLAGQAIASLTLNEPFLGEEPPEARSAVCVALDEPVGDLVRRLARMGARDGVAIVSQRPALVELERTMEELEPGLLVIDTLSEWACDEVADFNQAEGWTKVLRGLRQVAQATNCGILLLHHVSKASGGYRGSSQIGAGVDAIIEMTADPDDPTVRLIKSKGRIVCESFKIRFDARGGYRLEGPPASLDERILNAIRMSPGASVRGLRESLGGRPAEIGAAVSRLMVAGTIENLGNEKAKKLVLAGGSHAPRREPPREPLPPTHAKSLWEAAGTTREPPPEPPMVPSPLSKGAGEPLPMGEMESGRDLLEDSYWAGLELTAPWNANDDHE